MKNIIFGSGDYGKELYQLLDGEVAYFLDNSVEKQGKRVFGKVIYPVARISEEKSPFMVWIASAETDDMEIQLRNLGITRYRLFLTKKKLFSQPGQLILNLSDRSVLTDNESAWNEKNGENENRQRINNVVSKICNQNLLFHWVEIETINRCNGTCDFCPVSAGRDVRERKVMSDALFRSIIDQLRELNYGGHLALFSNNEPFLDSTIQEKIMYTRKQLPFAHTYLFTNGTLLNLEKVLRVLDYLDEIYIDNYSENMELIPVSREIVDYHKTHPEIADKVTISIRDPHEILTSRGGEAPNRQKILSFPDDSCLLPFRQLIVRPDGKLSLCCNDAFGKYTLGDLTHMTILDAWHGNAYRQIRKKLCRGRKQLDMCRLCDTFYPF